MLVGNLYESRKQSKNKLVLKIDFSHIEYLFLLQAVEPKFAAMEQSKLVLR